MVENKDKWIAQECRRQVVATLEAAKSLIPETGPAQGELGRALVCLEEAKSHFDYLIRHYSHLQKRPPTELEKPGDQPGRLA